MEGKSTDESFCRLCLGRTDGREIFEKCDGVSLVYKINCTVNIKVEKTDNRLTICEICKAKVEDFYNFKTLCVKTEAQGMGLIKGHDLPPLKIKEEPLDEDTAAGSSNMLRLRNPFGSHFEEVMLPSSFYTRDSSGKFVPCQLPAMVPIGNPIPLSSLSPSSLNCLRILDARSTSSYPQGGPSVDSGSTEVKVEKTNQNCDLAAADVQKPASLNHIETECTVRSDSSDDLAPIDNIINEVFTDKEDENSKSSAEGELSPKNKSSNQSGGAEGSRGQKRRSSRIKHQDPGKRRRSARTAEQKDEPSPTARLTRSSAGSHPRRTVITDSNSDEDFSADDPDDPEFSTRFNKARSSSTSSGDSSEEENTVKKKVPPALLRPSRNEDTDTLKKSCPHCLLTYKHWVSYDDHVKTCAGQKLKEKEKLGKSNSEEEGKEEEEEGDDQREVKCIACLKMFLGKKALREHMIFHQPPKGPPFECKTCHETFPAKGALICHMAFSHRGNLKDPILKTEKKKPHCEKCDEYFQNPGDFICHQVLYHKKK